MTTAIVLCAGPDNKWNNYLGAPKHFAPVDGEPILHRTVRLLKERGVDNIYISGPDARYLIEGTTLVTPPKDIDEENPALGSTFYQTHYWWHPQGRTILLLGDVYFTEAAMDTIVGFKDNEWQMFCRFNGSALTLSPYGEPFAVSFWPDHHADIMRATDTVRRLLEDKNNHVWRQGIWEYYRVMAGSPDRLVNAHIDWGRRTEIDDWTDDFDTPKEYDTFILRPNR